MLSTKELYQQYKSIIEKAADFNNASAVLSWDQEVNMPPKGYSFRGKQLATLASHAHYLITNENYGAIIQELISRNDLDEEQSINVRLSLEDYEKNKKLSSDFIEKLTQQTSDSYNAWIEARRNNNYTIYAPQLEKMIVLKKQQAELVGYKAHPYDALLDDYEKSATVAMLDPIFKMVGERLPVLLNKINAAQQIDDSFFYQNYPKQKQFDFSVEVLQKIGYDFDAGRLDYAEHPFSTSFAPTDARITTRVDEHNFAFMLWSTIHEGGHALYEQGLPESQYGLPLGAFVSLSIHESQSRLWENCVGRSLDFWQYFFPKLKSFFPGQLANIKVENLYKAANKVAPSLIRTEADELTYHFHVMIRYEIEKGLLTNDINTKDLAIVWNDYYKQYLGISANDDLHGVLQDVHWSHGSFGYFPTYSLGSFYAAQFYEHACKEIPHLQNNIANGDFTELLQWLRKNIHQYGRRYNSEALCKRITSRGLDFSSFMNYASSKYADIYNL